MKKKLGFLIILIIMIIAHVDAQTSTNYDFNLNSQMDPSKWSVLSKNSTDTVVLGRTQFNFSLPWQYNGVLLLDAEKYNQNNTKYFLGDGIKTIDNFALVAGQMTMLKIFLHMQDTDLNLDKGNCFKIMFGETDGLDTLIIGFDIMTNYPYKVLTGVYRGKSIDTISCNIPPDGSVTQNITRAHTYGFNVFPEGRIQFTIDNKIVRDLSTSYFGGRAMFVSLIMYVPGQEFPMALHPSIQPFTSPFQNTGGYGALVDNLQIISTNDVPTEIESEVQKEVTFYPNPATNQITFLGLKEEVQVSIYNTTGILVFNGLTSSSQLFFSLLKGFYVLDYSVKGINHSKKLIIN